MKNREGIGHAQKPKQFYLFKMDHKLAHGGTYRKKRKGRGRRPLSCKDPLHVVFKINRLKLKHRSFRSQIGLPLVRRLTSRYAKMFFVKVEQVSVQHDHIHMLIRTTRRSLFHYFFRVIAGQIAQQFEKQGLKVTDTPQILENGKGVLEKAESFWLFRPFSRVVRDYIQLNEVEVRGKIRYRKERLRGMSAVEREALWSG